MAKRRSVICFDYATSARPKIEHMAILRHALPTRHPWSEIQHPHCRPDRAVCHDRNLPGLPLDGECGTA